MESDADRRPVGRTPRDELDEIRRAVERPHIDYPTPPNWVWPAFGVAAAVYTWSFTLDQPSPGLPIMVVALAINFGIVGYLTRMRGVFPDFSTMPSALKREAIFTWIQIALLAAVVIAVWQLIHPAVAIALSGIGFAVMMYLHQRRHDALAAAILAEHHAHEEP